jgi:hypothetical protein
MKGEGENEAQEDWSENDVEISPFARQLTIIKAKKLIKRQTNKFDSKGQKGNLFSFQLPLQVTVFAYLTFLQVIAFWLCNIHYCEENLSIRLGLLVYAHQIVSC